jgi:hypothetical protein
MLHAEELSFVLKGLQETSAQTDVQMDRATIGDGDADDRGETDVGGAIDTTVPPNDQQPTADQWCAMNKNNEA